MKSEDGVGVVQCITIPESRKWIALVSLPDIHMTYVRLREILSRD